MTTVPITKFGFFNHPTLIYGVYHPIKGTYTLFVTNDFDANPMCFVLSFAFDKLENPKYSESFIQIVHLDQIFFLVNSFFIFQSGITFSTAKYSFVQHQKLF
jgi:hypothetical protein